MNRDEREILALRVAYPNATGGQIRRLWKLAKDKGVPIPLPPPSGDLDAILGSIIRHEHTHYMDMLRQGVSREHARNIIEPRVKKQIEHIAERKVCSRSGAKGGKR
ncbi:MAG: DUF2293 domain-containing protein [Thermodesulfovibrionales bacterium]|jgi:hypothetical protein